ncbi:hypothetical protein QTI66_10375 [Variovorax sp. J22R133]|uniref:hypothetical protein n=1 Tax=Variovorax brevis TaxID=3053503 RepID=UPI002577A232|nr:hypothetical protein [Variovorax sp. J22R133]MDM0112557.1 hypothetical protein [Variovorax sp. J22R133]
MTRQLTVSLFLCLACIPLAGQAACQTGLAERLHAKLHPGRELNHQLAVCEPWRGNMGRSIVVLPLARTDAQSGAQSLDLEVMVVQQPDNGNSERATVLARLIRSIPMEGEANPVTDIELDSTRYRLSPDLHVFGLRIMRRSSPFSQHPSSNETLSLYALKGNKLSSVLDALEMNMERGHWDTSCNGQFEKQQSMMSVAKSMNNGLADLILQRTDWKTSNALQGEECMEQTEPASYKTFTLRYDGSRYVPPSEKETLTSTR